MSDSVRKVNRILKNSNRKEIDEILDEIILSDRQSKIFHLFYIKKECVNFISDTIGVSSDTVYKELAAIRRKILSTL